MIDTPQLLQSTAQHTAVIHLVIPRSAMQKEMGPAIREVMTTLTAQGLAPAGPVFSHHLRMPSDEFDFEVGVPVKSPVTPVGRVQASQLPAVKVARTIYHGGYEGLGAAWGELRAWIAAEGHTGAPSLWESYVAGPESGPGPSAWRTELSQPLKA